MPIALTITSPYRVLQHHAILARCKNETQFVCPTDTHEYNSAGLEICNTFLYWAWFACRFDRPCQGGTLYLKHTPPAELHPAQPHKLAGRSVGIHPGAGMSSDASPTSQAKRVAILLCTYNGSRFLEEQLASIAAQVHSNWTLVASDDGSTDATLAILKAWGMTLPTPRLAVVQGPARGFVANFLSFITKPSIAADYYAFADQDDIWEADKLSRAVAWLGTVESSVPALYCARTRLVDSDNREIGLSPLFAKKPSFANALVQSIAGGNTMVFNEATRRLLADAGVTAGVVSHDWWLYLMVTGCGGHMHYDQRPTLRYRQHADNLVGANDHWRAQFDRVRKLFRGRFRTWCDQHVRALETSALRLTLENRRTLQIFAIARQQGLVQRLAGFLRCGIHRQTPLGNLGLLAAAIFKKI